MSRKPKKLVADPSLDFHNKQIADVALGLRCRYANRSCIYIMTSPLGHIYTNACPIGLHCVKLYGDTSYDDINWNTRVEFVRSTNLLPINKHAKKLKKWLQTYFTNPLQCEGIELSFCGLHEYAEFDSKVWMTIKNTCSAGELMSYSELAQRSGYSPGASKVVGYAIDKNPYMLVVGDHRIVKATGEIWCEDDSQRNKLRRLLLEYEMSFTDDSLEQALLKVKERNQSTKSTRQRKKKPKTDRKKATKRSSVNSSRKKRYEESDVDSGYEDEDESLDGQ